MVASVHLSVCFLKNARPILSWFLAFGEYPLILFVDRQKIIQDNVDALRKFEELHHESSFLISPNLIAIRIVPQGLLDSFLPKDSERAH